MRFRTGALLAILVVLPTVPAVSTAEAQDDGDAQELVERYAPIVMLRTQEHPCDSDGEPFVPMSVELLLDNPQIALRQVGNGDPTVMRAPGASDLSDLGEGFYLDAPGDSLNPGCLYEQDNDRFNAGQPAVVYAHIAQQPDEPDQLAVQYWLYWYYNDWNNKHEGDWEFVQLLFDASTIAEALATEPTSTGYAQHEGGERADWGGDKLQREGTHPVVYSSQRSHASYYNAALYMGRSGSEGFGCDNTDEPSTRVDPEVVLLPDSVDDAGDPLAWVNFDGRWGERHASPNNGPTGPNTKPQWTEPVTWHEGLRDSSFVVPSGDSRGVEVIDTFCSVVEWGSVQFIKFVASPARMLFVLAVLTALAVFLVRRTSWQRVGPLPVPRRRRAGEIARVATVLYRRHPGTFAAVGAIAIPVALAALLTGAIVTRLPLLGDLVEISDTEGTRRTLRHRLDHQRRVRRARVRPHLRRRGMGRRRSRRHPTGRTSGDPRRRRQGRRPLGCVRAGSDRHRAASLVFIGIPVAVWLFVRWIFTPQVIILEGLGGRRALARSAELVRHGWWHTALVTVLVAVVILGFGLVVGLLVLVIFTGLPLWALSGIVAVCNLLVMPFGALVMTFLYGDAVAADADRPPATSEMPAETANVSG